MAASLLSAAKELSAACGSPGASKKIAYTASEGTAIDVAGGTVYMLHATTACFIHAGGSSPPATDGTDPYLGTTMPYFFVFGAPGTTVKLHAIRATADGTLYVTAMSEVDP